MAIFGLLDPEDESTMILQYARNYKPNNTKVTIQKTWTFSSTSARTSNLTSHLILHTSLVLLIICFKLQLESYSAMETSHHSVIIITDGEPTILTNVKYCMSFLEHAEENQF